MNVSIKTVLLQFLSRRMGGVATVAELNPKLEIATPTQLTKGEINDIRSIWGSISSSINLNYWKIYKTLGFYSPYLVPDDIFAAKMLRVLNPLMDAYVFHKKDLYDIIYHGIRQPKIIAKHINGQLYVDGRAYKSNALNYFKGLKGKYIFKLATNSCGGQGVEIIDFDLTDDICLTSFLKKWGGNYICQELVSQSEKTKVFNPHSLNTFRINSLCINGCTSVTNIMFRHGRGDVIVDNAGAGGVCCGLDNNGTFLHHGIDANLNAYEVSETGIIYKGHKIDAVAKIVKYAIEAHQEYLPSLAHVAWDFALDDNDDPVMIEVNLGWPGIITEQLSSRRPIFNDRVDEVIEYCKANKNRLDWRDFLGRWI